MHMPGDSQSQGWEHYSSVFTAAKAGMDLVDKERVKQICYEASKVPIVRETGMDTSFWLSC